MVDRDKVIKGLECCREIAKCNKCPYKESEECCEEMRAEALALIMIQEPIENHSSVKPKKLKGYLPPMMVHYKYECPECESVMMFEQPYCNGCGKAVVWSD